MFGFFIKKTFFDMWDNIFRIVLINLGFLLSFAILIYFPLLFKTVPALFYISLFIGISILFIFTGAASKFTREIANYNSPGFHELVRYLKETALSSFIFAVINTILLFLLSIAFPTYGNIRSVVGPIAFSLLFWISIIWIAAFQYYFPVQSQLDTKTNKILKKMFLIFFDNTGFSIGLFIGTIFILIISVFTAFLLPGIGTIILWWNIALKLRLYKYDYLEEHPDADRKNIPWDVLLITDREKVGKRTLKGMIFPWKE
ncbi:MAG: hypothetical protein DRP58_00450 [Spirochaetes bacterium]|nr:MAG: hypothetical protein DRP58_00450 [Spirochaetota bacterium]